jgi:hypothetical protein
MEALAIAQAVVLAITVGALISFAQERFLGRVLDGTAAVVVNVLASLGVGIASVYHVGGFVITPVAGHDTFTVVIEILKVTVLVAAASKAAYEVLTKPVAERRA